MARADICDGGISFSTRSAGDTSFCDRDAALVLHASVALAPLPASSRGTVLAERVPADRVISWSLLLTKKGLFHRETHRFQKGRNVIAHHHCLPTEEQPLPDEERGGGPTRASKSPMTFVMLRSGGTSLPTLPPSRYTFHQKEETRCLIDAVPETVPTLCCVNKRRSDDDPWS